MRFAGIDIGGDRHAVAVVNEGGVVLVKSTFFGEEAAGYERVRALLDDPHDCVVAMEATGHYWRNLFAFLVGHGFKVALLNPLRTRRFAEEELERTKTDSVDALGIARFASLTRIAPAISCQKDQSATKSGLKCVARIVKVNMYTMLPRYNLSPASRFGG